jgi:hypothetical protein
LWNKKVLNSKLKKFINNLKIVMTKKYGRSELIFGINQREPLNSFKRNKSYKRKDKVRLDNDLTENRETKNIECICFMRYNRITCSIKVLKTLDQIRFLFHEQISFCIL